MDGECSGLDWERWCGHTRLKIFVAVHDLAGCCYNHDERSGPVVMKSQMHIAYSGTDLEVLLIAHLWRCSD